MGKRGKSEGVFLLSFLSGSLIVISMFLPIRGAADPIYLTNETTTTTISRYAQESIRKEYDKYSKDYPHREEDRERLWNRQAKGLVEPRAREVTIGQAPNPGAAGGSAAVQDATQVRRSVQDYPRYVSQPKLSLQEFMDRRSELYRIVLAMRNTEAEQLLLERDRTVHWSERLRGKALEQEEIFSKKLDRVLTATFSPEKFPLFHFRYVKPLREHRYEPEVSESELNRSFEGIVQTAMAGWEMDLERYQTNVVFRRNLMWKYCTLRHDFNLFFGEWSCPSSTRTPKVKGEMEREQVKLTDQTAAWMYKRSALFQGWGFLETLEYSRAWDIPGIDRDLLSLTRFEVNHPDGSYLERDVGKFSPIPAYQLVAYVVLEDLLGVHSAPKAALDDFTGYLTWVAKNLYMIDSSEVKFSSLSERAREKIRKIVIRALELALSNNQEALQYLSDVRDEVFFAPYVRGAKRALLPAAMGSGGNNAFLKSNAWGAWHAETDVMHLAQDSTNVNDTIFKFADLIPHFVNSEGLRELLKNRYGLPDIGRPELAVALGEVFHTRQEMLKRAQEGRVTTLDFVTGTLVIMSLVAAAPPIAGAALASPLLATVVKGVTSVSLAMTMAQSAIALAMFSGGVRQVEAQMGLAKALYNQISRQPMHVTAEEVAHYREISEAEVKTITTFAVATAAQFAMIPFWRTMLYGSKVKIGSRQFLETADAWHVKIRYKLAQFIFGKRKIDQQDVLEMVAERLMIKGRRLREVLSATANELKVSGGDSEPLAIKLRGYSRQFESRWGKLQDILTVQRNGNGHTPPGGRSSELVMAARAGKGQATPDMVRLEASWMPGLSSESVQDAIAMSSKTEFIQEFQSLAKWLKEEAVKVESVVSEVSSNGNVARAASLPTIHNIEAAEEMMLKLVNNHLDEKGLMALVDEGEMILKHAKFQEPWVADKEWANYEKLREKFANLRFDDRFSPGAIEKEKLVRTRLAPLAEELEKDKGTMAEVGVNSVKAKMSRQAAKFLNFDYSWIERGDVWLHTVGSRHFGYIPPGYFMRNVAQATSVNILGFFLGDRLPRTIEGLAEGESLPRALTREMNRSLINFTTGFFQSFFATSLSLANLTYFQRAIGSARAVQPALMLSITLNGEITGDLFNNACLNESVRRMYFETGIYKLAFSTVRRRWFQEFQSAFMRIGKKDGWRTGLAVVSTKGVESAVLQPYMWILVGEKMFKSSGACSHAERAALNDIQVMIPSEVAVKDPVVELARTTGTLSIIREKHPVLIEDLSPMGGIEPPQSNSYATQN